MVDEISRRNAEGVMETLRSMDRMVREQQVMLNKFSALIGGLLGRVETLERAEAGRLIQTMGNGPTETNK